MSLQDLDAPDVTNHVVMGTATKAKGIFLLAIALLCTSAGAVYLSFSYFKASTHWVSHTQEVRAAVGDVESAVNRAGRFWAEYLVAGSNSSLSQFQDAVQQVPVQFEHLHALTSDNTGQAQNCANLESITQERIQFWQNVIAQHKAEAHDLTRFLQQSIDFASRSAVIAETIRSAENDLLVARTREAQQRFVIAKLTVAISFALALFFLFYYYQLLRKELKARQQAEEVARAGYEHERELRQEQEKSRLFVDVVKDYAIYMLDPEGRVVSWNQGAQRIKGYTAADIIGSNFSCFFTEEDRRAGKPEEELRVASATGQFQGEGWRVRKDGSHFWGNIVLTAIRDEQGKLIGFAKITRDFTERMQAQEKLRRANAELASEIRDRLSAENRLAVSERSLRDLSHHLLRTQDEERKRIGRELHDSLGQYLAVLKMNLDSLESSLDAGRNGVVAQVQQCIQLAEESIKEMRTISYLLYPPMLEEVGLKSAIAWYLEGFSQRSQVQTTFEADLEFPRLSREIEIALFRILQESLTNVHRHSHSTTARVRLSRIDSHVILDIEDQGRGMPPEMLRESDNGWLGSLGVGIRGMNERMRQLGGRLEISSSGNGTTIKATVPQEETAVTSSRRTA